MTRIILAIAAALVVSGCAGTREAAKSAIMADQSVEGAASIITAPSFQQELEQLPEEQRARVEAALQRVLDLLASTRRSLAPVVARLQVGESVEVKTTPEMAVQNAAAFIVQADAQAGKAWSEVEEAKRQSEIISAVLGYGRAIVGTTASQLLLGGGGAGILTAVALAISRIRRLKTAVEDAVSAGTDLAEAKTPEQVKAAKDVAAARQDRNGTRKVIAPLVQRSKSIQRKATT